MTHLLEPLGLTATEDAVYGDLLQRRRSEPAALAAALALPVDEICRALDSLVARGLAFRMCFDVPSYTPADPELAVTPLIQQRRKDLTELQFKVEELASALNRTLRPDAESVVEVVRGEDAVLKAISMLQNSAREEMLIVDSPPYLDDGMMPNDGEFAALARGVRFRVVYHPLAIESPDARGHMRACVSAGEEARLHSEASTKMAIADGRLALVLASSEEPDATVRLLVGPCPLLDALLVSFESLWERAAIIDSEGQEEEPDPDLSERDRRLLSLLASGMKDRTIARTLGVTERTVGRRVTELMQRLDADTRFRAGVRAVQRGWI